MFRESVVNEMLELFVFHVSLCMFAKDLDSEVFVTVAADSSDFC